MKLGVCEACARHVRATESACPFCGAGVVVRVDPPRQRARRAVVLAGTAALAWACGSSAPAVFYGAVSPPEPDGGDGDAFFPIYGGADVMPPDVSQPDASTDAATDARDGSIDGSDADSD